MSARTQCRVMSATLGIVRHEWGEGGTGGGRTCTHQRGYFWFPPHTHTMQTIILSMRKVKHKRGSSSYYPVLPRFNLLWESLPEPDRHIHLHKLPGQDGCHVQLCGCLLVRAFLQSISQLIELISITKGILFKSTQPYSCQ